MRWNKPKALVFRMLFILSMLSLLIAFFWIFSAYVWIHQPNKIKQLDKYIPNIYQEKIQKSYKQITKANTNKKKYLASLNFINNFPEMTSLHKGYHHIGESYTFVTKYLLENKNELKALQKANEWQNKYPYDFNAKFSYYQTLKQIDPLKASKYIADLFFKFTDVDNIIELYFSDLIVNGNFSDAINLAKKQKNNSINNSQISFMFFYKNDKYKQFQANTKVILDLDAYSHKGNNYQVEFNKQISGFKGLRLDIDGMKTGLSIKNLEFEYHLKNKNISNVPFKPLHDIKTISENVFKITGADPYFEIITPQILLNSDEVINLTASLTVSNDISLVMNSILNNSEWQFFYSNDKFFNEKHSKKFSLKFDGDLFTIELGFDHRSYETLRLDFPSFINLNPSQLEIKINNNLVLQEQNISEKHHFNLNDTVLKVDGDDPYLIFKLDSPTILDKVEISFKLGENK